MTVTHLQNGASIVDSTASQSNNDIIATGANDNGSDSTLQDKNLNVPEQTQTRKTTRKGKNSPVTMTSDVTRELVSFVPTNRIS